MNMRGIIIAIGVLATVSTIAITYLSLENNIAKQNQAEEFLSRIHLYTHNGTTYVRLNDLHPNSAQYFIYPYYENLQGSRINSWILLRLPSELGGNKSDIFSYRAYSTVDLAPVGQTIRYDPRSEKLSEEQYYDTYEPVNGTLVAGYLLHQRHGNQTLPNALPNLDLGVDDQGYIYVKKPTMEVDKNGVIGLGRKIS